MAKMESMEAATLMPSFLSLLPATVAAAAAFGLASGADAAVILGAAAVESGGQVLPYVVGDAGLGENARMQLAILEGNYSEKFAVIGAMDAAAYLSSMPTDDRWETFGVSMGSSGSDPERVRHILELRGQNPERAEATPGERYRGDRGRDADLLPGWETICSCTTGTGYDASVAAVPEPSAPVLAALAMSVLFRRRRQA